MCGGSGVFLASRLSCLDGEEVGIGLFWWGGEERRRRGRENGVL
jgi:hypothetical protein